MLLGFVFLFRDVDFDGVDVLLGFGHDVALLQVFVQFHLNFDAIAGDAADGAGGEFLFEERDVDDFLVCAVMGGA